MVIVFFLNNCREEYLYLHQTGEICKLINEIKQLTDIVGNARSVWI